MKKPPCGKDCAERCPGCHDRCERYKEWHEELERAKEFVRTGNHVPTNEKARRAGWRNMRWGNEKYRSKK